VGRAIHCKSSHREKRRCGLSVSIPHAAFDCKAIFASETVLKALNKILNFKSLPTAQSRKPIMNLADVEDQPLEIQWEYLLQFLEESIGKRPADLNGVLFLIGVQELGQGAKRFTKEQKQDLMHIGICKVLSLSSYYIYEHTDKDGWPHYILNRALPQGGIEKQEALLKMHVIEYFKNS